MGGEAEAECPEGGYLEASSLNPRLRQGKIGPCPPPKDICPGLACEEDCGGRGDCAAGGECRCFLGHGGPACALDVPAGPPPPQTGGVQRGPRRGRLAQGALDGGGRGLR